MKTTAIAAVSPQNAHPSSMGFSPHLARLSRQASIIAASSDSEITYADVPSDAQDVTTEFVLASASQPAAATFRGTAGTVSRQQGGPAPPSAPAYTAAHSFLIQSSARPSHPSTAAAAAGLPPAALSVRPLPCSSAGQKRPFGPAPAIQPLGPSRNRTPDPLQQKQRQQQPSQASLLEAFLAADQAVNQSRPWRAVRSRVEEWRDEVAEEEAAVKTRELEKDEGELEENETEDASSKDLEGGVTSEEGVEDDLVSRMKENASPRRRARGSFSPPSASPSAFSPAASSERERGTASKKGATKKGGRKNISDDRSSPSAGDQSARKKRKLTTKQAMAMLPARRRIIRAREDTQDEVSEVSEAETDYECACFPVSDLVRT
ncbi:hypothetical protein JCM11251_002597 [Rhodosporidiobolus azoricus]